MQAAQRVLDTLGFGHRFLCQVGAGPVRDRAEDGGQRRAERAEPVRRTPPVVIADHQSVSVHRGQPFADELLTDEGELRSNVADAHGAVHLGQGHRGPGGPLGPDPGESLLDALGVDGSDGEGGRQAGGSHGGVLMRMRSA